MEDNYFQVGDVKRVRLSMKKFDQYVVTTRTSKGHFCLLSCVELAEAQHYIESNNLRVSIQTPDRDLDGNEVSIYRVGDDSMHEVKL